MAPRAQLRLEDLTPVFGSEVLGFDPGTRRDPATTAFLRQAFDRRALLLFRGLPMDDDLQEYLTRTLVGIEGRPGDALDEHQELPATHYVSNSVPGANAPHGRLLFHSDLMSSPYPAHALSLYAVEIEPPVAPTIFACTTHAWDTLPDDLAARVDGAEAVHGYETDYPDRDNDDGDVLRPVFETPQMTTTPVARRHPRTGRTVLYVSQQKTREIVGLPADESEALLAALFAHLYDPATLYSHEWREGDLVVWDNFAVQHARDNVRADGPTRTFRKVLSSTPSALAAKESPRFLGAV